MHAHRSACLAVLLGSMSAGHAIDLSVTGLDGAVTVGRAIRVAPEIVLSVNGDEVAFGWDDVIDVRPAAAARPGSPSPERAPRATPMPFHWELADGSAFGARIAEASDAGLTVQLASGSFGTLTLGAVRRVTSATASPSAVSILQAAGGEEPLRDDVAVIARDGREATIRGAVRRITSSGLTFSFQGKDRDLSWSIIAGVAFSSATPRGTRAVIHTRDGDCFAGRVIRGTDDEVTLQSGVFQGLTLPWSHVERIECRSERLTFLSDLHPAAYDARPFIAGTWELGVDRSLTGQPLTLGGRTFAKGLVMRSRSRVVYTLGGRYSQFVALAGIADEMGARGDVTMSVIGGGRVLWSAENVRGGEPPREVLVDVTGVDVLELFVDYGEDLDLSDHACWAFARLIR